MKSKAIMSEVEFSYEELQGLESHFRQLQKEAVVDALKKPSGDMVCLLGKMLSPFRSTDQHKSTKARP